MFSSVQSLKLAHVYIDNLFKTKFREKKTAVYFKCYNLLGARFLLVCLTVCVVTKLGLSSNTLIRVGTAH